ncbi:MAG TPA: nucleotidyltransferase domain-containing protein [Microbacterium sp.]|nr:nucleotidyltransferase domain-containing protein [Microbacterium sp.]
MRGVRAVALGGSRARGTHHPDSDFDLGLYVDGDVDRVSLAEVASRWSDGQATIAPAGGWGQWVDSGAWLTVQGVAVDLILRDVQRVIEQCERAVAGQFQFHTQPGHPLGFLDVAYAGEVATCVPLSDPSGFLRSLTEAVRPYPDPLRRAMLENLWQVDFLLDGAQKGATQRDVGYVALCASTATMLLAHGWHASAGQWVVNEKGLIPNVDRLPLDTHGFSVRASELLSSLGSVPSALLETIDGVRELPRPDPQAPHSDRNVRGRTPPGDDETRGSAP